MVNTTPLDAGGIRCNPTVAVMSQKILSSPSATSISAYHNSRASPDPHEPSPYVKYYFACVYLTDGRALAITQR